MQSENQIYCEDIPSPNWSDLPDFSLQSISLWKISIENSLSQLRRLSQLLSEEESIRTAKYHQQRDKDRFTIGRGMLRQLLAYYLECNPSDIDFEKGLNNKPFINHQRSLGFNVSYSNDFIVIALSTDDIGVDIEYIHPKFDYPLLMENCFMEKEIKTITSSSAPRSCFFKLWTRKEALLKATSLGLDDYLIDFSCLDGFQSIPPNLHTRDDWQVRSFLMDDSYWIGLSQRDKKLIQFIDASAVF